MAEAEPIPRASTPMSAPKVRRYVAIAPVITLVLPLVLCACGGGYDAKSKSTEELIATVGNPTDKNPTKDQNVVSGWNSGPRCDAAEELGRRKATSAVDVLIAALRDGRVDGCVAQAFGVALVVPGCEIEAYDQVQRGHPTSGCYADPSNNSWAAGLLTIACL